MRSEVPAIVAAFWLLPTLSIVQHPAFRPLTPTGHMASYPGVIFLSSRPAAVLLAPAGRPPSPCAQPASDRLSPALPTSPDRATAQGNVGGAPAREVSLSLEWIVPVYAFSAPAGQTVISKQTGLQWVIRGCQEHPLTRQTCPGNAQAPVTRHRSPGL
jgi:hypothetical protein